MISMISINLKENRLTGSCKNHHPIETLMCNIQVQVLYYKCPAKATAMNNTLCATTLSYYSIKTLF